MLLANVLPGFREIRAPLVAGYLWLLWAWLMFGDAVPAQNEVRGRVARLYELDTVLRDLGLAGALSVAAFLVGSLWTASTGALARRVGQASLMAVNEERIARRHEQDLSQRPAYRLGLFARISFDGYVLLERWAKERAARDAGNLVEEVLQEFSLVTVQLLAQSPALHGEVDRRENEAIFRLAIAPPLVAVGVALSKTFFLTLGVCAAGVALLMHGLSLRLAAGDALAAALLAEPSITPPALARREAATASQPRDENNRE